jgi:hypothetical protein
MDKAWKPLVPRSRSFQSGDEVWYAGSIIRSGTNAQFHLVDEPIVAHKPKSLDFTHAAALCDTSVHEGLQSYSCQQGGNKDVLTFPRSMFTMGLGNRPEILSRA